MTSLPSRSREIRADFSPDEALKVVIRYGQSAGYKVEQLDEAGGRVVFADAGASMLSTKGFFYPVFVTPTAGGSLISVGIRSMYWQAVGLDGPLDTFVAGLRAFALAGSAG